MRILPGVLNETSLCVIGQLFTVITVYVESDSVTDDGVYAEGLQTIPVA